MGIGFFPPRCVMPGPTPPAAAGCVDFVFNSQAELEAQFPAVAGVHTLNQDGSYCWGEFALTAGNRVVVPTGMRQLHQGHGPSSEVQFDNGAGVVGFMLDSGSEVMMRDMHITQLGADAIGLRPDGTRVFLSCLIVEADQGVALQHAANDLLAQNVRLIGGTGDQALLLGPGGAAESHWTNLYIEGVTDGNGVTVQEYSTFMWVGGRVENAGGAALDAVEIAAGAGVDISDVSLIGIEFAGTWGDAVQHTSGDVHRCKLDGCSGEPGVGTLVDWLAANIPSPAGLTVVNCNTEISAAGFLQGHSQLSPRCNYKANTNASGLSTETPIVP